MSPAETDADDFLEDIYGPKKPTFTDAETRKFKPWHKPRKHYIRVKQWCALVQRLIKKLGLKKGETLRYLGMPGEDFLDIRVLHGTCANANVSMRYLGFDSTADFGGEYELNLSRHEVYNLQFIDPMSVVVKDRVEHVALEKSAARVQLEKHGPFDVINLDLCDSIANPSDKKLNLYFEALATMCDLQVTNRAKPWMLFLTTRASRDQIDQGTKNRLLDCILSNIKSNADFAERLSKELNIDQSAIQAEMHGKEPLTHAELVNAFGLGVGKWLLKLMMSASPKLHVQLLESYSYRVDSKEPDMLSLAFWFEPVMEPRVDPTGLTRTQKPKPGASNNATEPELALKLIKSIVDIADIDRLLHDAPDLNEQWIKKSAALLSQARYNIDTYREWSLEEAPTELQ